MDEQHNEKMEETIKENGEVINVNDDNYMDTLNNAIQDLSDVVEPMADFFNIF